MNAYNQFFEENKVMLKLERKKIHVRSIDEAQSIFLDYVTINKVTEDNLKKNGELSVDKEIIAVFSINGRLWSTDEEEIIWRDQDE